MLTLLAITKSLFFILLAALATRAAHAQTVDREAAPAPQSSSRSAGEKSESRAEKGSGESSAYGLGLEDMEAEGSLTARLPAIFKHFGAEYWARTDLARDSVHNADPNAQTLNRFSLLYKPDGRHVWQIMQEVDVLYGHIGNATAVNMNDPFVSYIDTKLAKLGEWNITGALRLYLPTGEASRFVTKRAGALAGYLLAEYSWHHWDLSNFFYAIQHNQRQDSYLAPSGNTLQPASNDDSELDNYFEADYNCSPTFQVFHSIGLENLWERPMLDIGIQQRRYLFNETGARYKVSPTVTLTASIVNDAAMLNPSSHAGLQVYREDESWYRLYVDANL